MVKKRESDPPPVLALAGIVEELGGGSKRLVAGGMGEGGWRGKRKCCWFCGGTMISGESSDETMSLQPNFIIVNVMNVSSDGIYLLDAYMYGIYV